MTIPSFGPDEVTHVTFISMPTARGSSYSAKGTHERLDAMGFQYYHSEDTPKMIRNRIIHVIIKFKDIQRLKDRMRMYTQVKSLSFRVLHYDEGVTRFGAPSFVPALLK